MVMCVLIEIIGCLDIIKKGIVFLRDDNSVTVLRALSPKDVAKLLKNQDIRKPPPYRRHFDGFMTKKRVGPRGADSRCFILY